METLFYYLAVLQIGVGLYLLWGGLQWLAYARRRLRGDPGFHTPRVAVLCPCKGLELGLERNLAALTEFEYKNYEVFFILASGSDPAYNAVKRIAEASKIPAHVVIAAKPEGCSEKVNNLRVAVQQLPEEFEVLVFADSDGRPAKGWLRRLVAPLKDSSVGAVTTMRWLIPNRPSLSSSLLAAWNASVVTLLTEKGKNFCWGGGTAIDRVTFEQANVMEEWSHSASDDYSMTRALQRANRPILFAPDCLTVSYVDVDLRSMLEFTSRQILITRVYAFDTWALAAITHLLYCATALLGAALVVGNILATLPAFHLVILTFAPMLLAAIRSGLRVVAATEILPADRGRITSQTAGYIALGTIVPFLFILNFLVSVLTRKMRWRGITYELISPQQTRILAC